MTRANVALVAVATLLFATGANAQETAETYFRQYSEALAAGDLSTAEAAAANALTASTQRDGRGGHTAALALNLARARLQLGQWRQARAPALLAYELSHASPPATAVDPVMSELLWGRVRVETEGFAGADFLSDSLDRAESRADLLGDRYDAANHLGLWAVQSHNYIVARRAWALAADAAQGAPYDTAFARGRARAYEGIAIALQSLTRDPVMSAIVARQVRERLSEAHTLVRPFAFNAAQAGEVTAPHEVYSQILAWEAAIWSRMASDNPARQDDDRVRANITSIGAVPVCTIRRTEGRRPVFSADQVRRGGLGSVVVRLRFADDGDFLGAEVVASVGDEAFVRDVSAAAASWDYTVEIANGCTVLPVLYVPVTFYFRE
ncbi:MAG: hypothetical protein JNL81_07575 [Hyphomonadaceae bacterium]|nr:hypothetical protein [Hyphomonadaceae bacterium]